jgi:hypothetical protein
VSKLAELLEWALSRLEEMLAHLSLELLLESVELTLVAVEVVVVGLLSEVSEDLAWWVVEVSWSSLRVHTLALISRLLLPTRGGPGVVTRTVLLWGGPILIVAVLLRGDWSLHILVATEVLHVSVSWLHFVVDNLKTT